MNFLKIQQGEYLINLNAISDIDCSDPKSWEVAMSSGTRYTVEGADLKALKQALGL